ncbi:hypothetical protein BDV96DRAFT_654571 [Lophiotrema nucula]|uniref:Ankyrin repeat-containing domain protein n=1 Tax=Lophiotrema nucula TaxID=690887 RepID=A0A6A5YK87_9PLEO|nr:hypothetical protein BDV96DRAFT_654571 [Lophiotrema nucula]
MRLLDLPLKLVYAILTESVSVFGIRKAVELRLVCKLFDAEVQRTIFEHPMFELTKQVDADLPATMGPIFTARLILTKLKSQDAGRRSLCKTITEALNVLETVVEDFSSKRQRYTESLAIAAARKLQFIDVIECLSPDPEATAEQSSPSRPFSLMRTYKRPCLDMTLTNGLSNALIAAISIQDTAAITALQEAGGDILRDTVAFGHPIQAAAANGLTHLTREMISKDITRSVQTRNLALSAAARAGQQDLITLILDDPTLFPFGCIDFNTPILYALQYGHETLALLLLRYRNTMVLELGETRLCPNSFYMRREALRWFNFISNGVRYKRYIFVQNAMEHFPNLPDMWVALFTQAVRKNSVQVVEALLANTPSHIATSIASEESRTALKIAVEGTNLEMMDLLAKSVRFNKSNEYIGDVI